MLFKESSPILLTAFMAIVIFMIAVVLWAAKKSSDKDLKKVSLFLFLWIIGFSCYVLSGFSAKHVVPGLPIFFGTIIIAGIIIGTGRLGTIFLKQPVWALVLFQSFRLPLELILHAWAEGGTVPSTMTWTGQNFDILTGVLALLVLLKPFRNNRFAWFFNIFGFVMLINVLRVAVMSSGLPFSWDVQPRFELALHYPYAFIAFILVFFALTGHLILARKLAHLSNA